MKKPVLVVTSHFIKPVETRINSEYEVRRKGMEHSLHVKNSSPPQMAQTQS
jgi:hypothetical protein